MAENRDLIPHTYAENSTAISKAVGDFSDLLAHGFELKIDVGRDLLRVIENMISKLDHMLADSRILTQELKLGKTPAALVYRPFQATLATDALHGFIPAIKSLREDLQQLKDKINNSIATYSQTEEENKINLSIQR